MMLCPSVTYWASAIQVFSLGATVVFADIEPDTLCIDPDDIEHRITDRTKAIMVVHYIGYPADMDRIMPIVRKMSRIADTGAEIIATACPACIIQLADGVRSRGLRNPVRHVIQLLAERLR